ncbi:24398_t:CDS:2, partial [Dentiscutata erythropus]
VIQPIDSQIFLLHFEHSRIQIPSLGTKGVVGMKGVVGTKDVGMKGVGTEGVEIEGVVGTESVVGTVEIKRIAETNQDLLPQQYFLTEQDPLPHYY